MCNFIGDYEVRADQKNRIVLPTAFKRKLEGDGETDVHLVVKKDIVENCICIYPMKVWEKIMADLEANTQSFNPIHAKFTRSFLRNTSELSLDASGRLLIPQRIMDLINPQSRDMVFLGANDHIELWEKSEYESSNLPVDELSQLAEAIFKK